jgi:hypothetical protein
MPTFKEKIEINKQLWASVSWEDVDTFIGSNAKHYKKAWDKAYAVIVDGKKSFSVRWAVAKIAKIKAQIPAGAARDAAIRDAGGINMKTGYVATAMCLALLAVSVYALIKSTEVQPVKRVWPPRAVDKRASLAPFNDVALNQHAHLTLPVRGRLKYMLQHWISALQFTSLDKNNFTMKALFH